CASGALLHFLSVAKQNGLDIAHAVLDAAAEIAAPKFRQDRVFDNERRHSIGHHRLEPAADFDTDFAVVRRDDEQDAVILALLSDAPLAGEADAVILDRVAVERLD